LVTDALNNRDRRIAIVTYTNNNLREIEKRFAELNSGIPKHVEVMTWFSFLLRECARPYQRSKFDEKRIESLLFVNKHSTQGIPECQTKKYYIAGEDFIYSDKISRFVVECEEKSSMAVTSRLKRIYTDIFVDEFQDLAGWDFEVVQMLMRSGISVTLVGDPRQHIYSTHPSPKNKKYIGIGFVDLAKTWNRKGVCSVEHMNATYRCNGLICDFSNGLWPNMDAMTPLRNDTIDHQGVYLVAESLIKDYVDRFKPQVLRHDKRANTYGQEALNFGVAKGLEFERVLIIPTKPIKKYLATGIIDHAIKSRDRLHVAVTRAWHSVAFVFDGHSPIVSNRWNSEADNRYGKVPSLKEVIPALGQSQRSTDIA